MKSHEIPLSRCLVPYMSPMIFSICIFHRPRVTCHQASLKAMETVHTALTLRRSRPQLEAQLTRLHGKRLFVGGWVYFLRWCLWTFGKFKEHWWLFDENWWFWGRSQQEKCVSSGIMYIYIYILCIYIYKLVVCDITTMEHLQSK